MNDIDYLKALRKQTQDSNGKRYRIFLEVVTSCFGNCSGCALSYTARKNLNPDISLEQIQDIFKYFVPIINNKPNLTTTSLVLGTGEYFLMNEDFLNNLFKEVNLFFKQLKTPINVLAVSSAMLMSEDKIIDKIMALKNNLDKNQFAIEGVIDPLLLEVHYDRYLKNYQDMIKHFPLFDLVVNLSDGLKPQNLDLLNKLLSEMDVFNVDIQYQLNGDNTYRVKTSPENFINCMDHIYANLKDKDSEVIDMSIALPMPTNDDDGLTVFDYIKKNAKESLEERILVKGNGNLYPVGTAYGDIFLDERYGFKPIGNISKPIDLKSAEEEIFKYMKNIFIKKAVCHTCEHNKQCYGSGYSFYNKFTTGKECDNVGLFAFRRASELQNNNN